MSATEGQKQALQAAAGQALDALRGLNEEQRAQVEEGARLLEQVLVYAQLVVKRTRSSLISREVANDLTAAASAVAANPVSAASNGQDHADSLLGALAGLPAARGRDLEQAAHEALTGFAEAAEARLGSLLQHAADADAQLSALRTAVADESARLRGEIETAAATLQTTVETLATTAQASVDSTVATIQTKAAEFDSVLTTQRQAVEELRASQSEAFETSQGERAATFQGEFAKIREELAGLRQSAAAEVEARVEEIRRMEREAGGLAGSIALAGTADRYGEEAKAQKVVADRLRLLTFAFAVAAVGMAVWAATHETGEWRLIAAKLAVSAVLGGLATYTGKQSARHRVREERARNLQLELTAFSPFIEPLDKAQQDYERVIMTRKTFGQVAALPELDDDHAFGPLGPVEAVRRQLLAETDGSAS